MSENFAFNAPRFFDFDSELGLEDKDHAETYFELDHECAGAVHQPMRKSTSLGNLGLQHHAVSSTNDMSNGIVESLPECKRDINDSNHGVTQKESFGKLVQPKEETDQECLVSKEEAIGNSYIHHKQFMAMQVPCPKSPALLTKTLARNHNLLSKEKKDMEETKKFVIRKADPVNPRVMQGPVKPVSLSKKPNTVIEPVKLTQYPLQFKKAAGTENLVSKCFKPVKTEMVHFGFDKRNPQQLMKRIQSTDKLLSSAAYKPTKTKLVPFSFDSRDQQLLKKKEERIQNVGASKTGTIPKTFVPAVTRPVPFSFDQRDKLLPIKRKELIDKAVEEQKRAREFHANYPPKYVKNRSHRGSAGSLKSEKSTEDVSHVPVFKARPATILHQKPFEPKKLERPLIEVTQFHLNTERRAIERREFELKLKKKTEMQNFFREEHEKKVAAQEAEERAIQRKHAEHTAQPVRHFNQILIKPTNKITIPISPKFGPAARRNNKENNPE